MRYLTFTLPEQTAYDFCFLAPRLHMADMERLYLQPHMEGLQDRVLAYDLHKGPKRTPVKDQREYLGDLLPILRDMKVRYLVVCDAEYLKTLTKAPTAEGSLGYVLPCTVEGYEDMKIVYCPNFATVFNDPPKIKDQIRIALSALVADYRGSYIAPGVDIIKFCAYPRTPDEIRDWLYRLLSEHKDLTADIEAFSLKHYDAGIGTISFAWSKHEGIAFPVDFLDSEHDAATVRIYLREFFRVFAELARQDGRKMRWHMISYDVYVLIYQLFMKDLLDTEGLLEGLEVMLASWDCTKLITYLATNSAAGNTLSLKAQAQEFAGKWAVEDITDIRKIPLDELLQYNLVDTLATWFVYEKHWDTLVADQQLEIYETIFKPGMWDIIQMQLTGLPVDKAEVHKVSAELEAYQTDALNRIQSSPCIEEFVYYQTREAWQKDFEERKGKAKNPDKIKVKDFATFPVKTFNPNSPQQLQTLLYDERFLGFPVLDLSDTKLPATGGKNIAKLKNHTKDPIVIEFLEALIDFKTVNKFITDFIPSFLAAPQGPDGWHYLFGFFNLGGTVSGRLSSSGPNLQNLPSNPDPLLPNKGKFAKLIKRCVKAPPGWLFVGLDFASLEDRISALTTKDPNKLKVYTDGYDGHCLRAYSYFGDQMPDIDPTSVESINSIEKKYKPLRQDSKTPTFLLTYGGTWIGIMAQLGWPEAKAKSVETKYHDLYRVSDEWVAERIQEATQTGYVTVAFGLRVRTPLLHQTLLGNSRTPWEAEAEGRTAGNALGQSWCLLNTRAGIEFNAKVRASKYRLDIRPCAQIHDAGYHLIRDNMATLLFYNEHMVKAVEWQDDPLIWHDQVKLGGEVSIFYPNWATEMVIPNGASVDDINTIAMKHWTEYCGG